MSRRYLTAKFKTKVVLESLKEGDTTKELALKYKVHPQQINTWKREFISRASSLFETSKKEEQAAKKQDEKTAQLLQTIGLLKVENDFLKKSLKKQV